MTEETCANCGYHEPIHRLKVLNAGLLYQGKKPCKKFKPQSPKGDNLKVVNENHSPQESSPWERINTSLKPGVAGGKTSEGNQTLSEKKIEKDILKKINLRKKSVQRGYNIKKGEEGFIDNKINELGERLKGFRLGIKVNHNTHRSYVRELRKRINIHERNYRDLWKLLEKKEKDVKNFINKLKDVLPDATHGKTSIHKEIDKLAGKNLI